MTTEINPDKTTAIYEVLPFVTTADGFERVAARVSVKGIAAAETVRRSLLAEGYADVKIQRVSR